MLKNTQSCIQLDWGGSVKDYTSSGLPGLFSTALACGVTSQSPVKRTSTSSLTNASKPLNFQSPNLVKWHISCISVSAGCSLNCSLVHSSLLLHTLYHAIFKAFCTLDHIVILGVHLTALWSILFSARRCLSLVQLISFSGDFLPKLVILF